MRVDEIFGGKLNLGGRWGDVELVKGKDGKVTFSSRMLAALKDAEKSAKKTDRKPVLPTGKLPDRS